MLSSIADTYLTPVLTKIANVLNLSETIAGVTLLAFANGAPDIVASATAGDTDGGIFIAVGALFGAASFGYTVVLGYCIVKNKGVVEMPKAEWIRDISFYLIGALVILLYGYIGKINTFMSIAFIGIYLVYFVVVLYVSFYPSHYQY
jgi:solute carrier family 24 (sodium/potassium/calcium exchanger), member 6